MGGNSQQKAEIVDLQNILKGKANLDDVAEALELKADSNNVYTSINEMKESLNNKVDKDEVVKINNDGSFTFYDANIKPGLGDYPEYVKDVKFIKEKDILNEENSFDNAMDNLNRYYINRNGN